MITLSRGRAALSKVDTADDEQIMTWINAITAQIEQYVNQPIVSATKVLEKFYDFQQIAQTSQSSFYESDPFGFGISGETAAGARLLIPLPFVAVPVALTAAQYKRSIFDSWTTATDIAIYTIDGARHLGRQAGFAGYFWKFTFTAGYTLTLDSENRITASNVPNDLQQVVCEMLQIMDRNSGAKNTLGYASITESQGGANLSTAFKDMRPEWQVILDNYAVQPISSAFSVT